jgi:hypothetical protein
MGDEPVYFVYVDKTTGEYYYYENATGTTTYERPTQGWLLDPAHPSREYDFGSEPTAASPEGPPSDLEAPAPPPPEDAISPPEAIPSAPGAVTSQPEATHEPEAVANAAGPALVHIAPSTSSGPPHRVRGSWLRRARTGTVVTPDSDMKKDTSKSRKRRETSDLTVKPGLVIDVPRPVRDFRETAIAQPSDPPRDGSFFPNPQERVLPYDLKCEIQQFQVAEVAQQFFREHRKPGGFARHKVDLEALVSFQTEPLKDPLLRTHTKNSVKASIDAFKLILSYTGVDVKDKVKPGSAITASRLVTQSCLIAELRDEVFFQLIKQTRGNPNHECLFRTWELFLIFATLVPSSRDSERWIKAHLYQSISDPDPAIGDLAQFTYIRFSSRFIIGKPTTDFALPMIQQIPKEINDGHRVFGASIYEQLWNQRKMFPRAPIPVILHQMAEALIAKGCEQWEGLFRLPGNSSVITRMQKTMNEGGNPLELAVMNDLASLFKSWFGELPEPLVNADMLPGLKTAYETKSYTTFVKEMPPVHMSVLMYLIGFLKRLMPAAEATKMTARNYAICFAPNLIDTSSVADPMQMSEYAKISQDFVVSLIEGWDTTGMYPPNPELMSPLGSP